MILSGLFLLFCIFVTGLISYFALNDPFDYVPTNVNTYQDAKSFVEDGKMPKILPRSTGNISLIYKLVENLSNGPFHVNQSDLHHFEETSPPATRQDLVDSKVVITGADQEIKSVLENNPESVQLYQDQDYVYAILIDGTVYCINK